ncbi:fucose metabolic process [Desmophyllum pertusum]|uniref:Fucose metabolic process n=1 Tax=Desmophyllum pertusum TaxID=174260 RepID=A0A9X0D4S8_9CNID|nr:fucose metabolic process [Desmophyllum pertusum]
MRILSGAVFSSLLFVQILASDFEDFGPDDPQTRFEFGAAVDSKVENETDISPIELKDVVIVVRSQHNAFHVRKAKALRQALTEQAEAMGEKDHLELKMMHKDWAPLGAWTIIPIINSLDEDYGDSKRWIFFCEDETIINLPELVQVLNKYDARKEMFLGHAIQDKQAAIIHHFAFHQDPSQFSFPDFAAGWAVSVPLLNRLSKRLQAEPPKSDFTIDVQHEVAMFIRDEGQGTLLTDVPEFCTSEPVDQQECVTSLKSGGPECGELSLDNIFFAVKTTKKYHKDRVPIVQKTVGQHAKHIAYYSETEDPSIPTEDIGVPNTERGHCAKLQAIIDRSASDPRAADKPWLVILDDDTIMSVPRLQKLLACYDPKEVTLLGERYGYGLTGGYGYEYITGGGSMILSRAGIEALLKSGCRCWEPDSPDDMWLGNCFRRLGVPVTHNPAFHQAKPNEYVPSLLAHQTPVSFHKHYDLDPLTVYKEYLS